MDVKRFDVVTDSDSASASICTVPSGKAYTVTGFTIVETEGNSGEITLKVGNQVIGQFGISGPDTIYPITNVNMSANETLKIDCSTPGVYVTASVVERDVE